MFSNLSNATNITISLGPTKITIGLWSVFEAALILLLGFVVARLLRHHIVELSSSVKHVWIINEDTAKTVHNMVVLIALFYALKVLGLLDYKVGGSSVSEILSALVVFYSVYVLAKKSKDYLIMHAAPSELPEVQIKAKILYYTLITIAFFIALNIAGLTGRLTTIIAAAGITGIVLGFASQTVIANFISGLFLYSDKPLEIGQAIRLEVEGNVVEGVVEDIRILSTRIRQWDGTLVRVPNEKLFNSNIINLQKFPVRRVDIVVGIAYKEDTSRAIDVIRRTLDEMPLVLAEPEPWIYVTELGDSSVNLSVRAWVPSDKWFDVRTEIVERIKRALDDAGIEIPFPQRVNWFPEPIRIKLEDSDSSNTFIRGGEKF
ncbi:mechanosensitive ion channel family protein [Thermococcus gammatolerans]|uniref:mechanosensitive ion channel family protein n=1 Tax=Thermococcus gammatolerans TaxID=187878 RepID=UPI00066246AF|nr:mechanosensitive ion channel family protein [Thermococcus gammatolerans]